MDRRMDVRVDGRTEAARRLLMGPASLDIYVVRDLVLPGGGALNMAWHLGRAGRPWHLLTRVGDDRPDVFETFLGRHGLPATPDLVARGPSASIDIVIQPDLQPLMDNFVEGVWAAYRSTPEEEAVIEGAERLHAVLVEGAIRELERLHREGRLAHLEVSADFLGFRHYTVERFAATMRAVDIGVVGWPGRPDDPTVADLAGVAHALGKLVVITFGSQGVLAADGRDGGTDRFVAVDAVEVEGTTVGCGDAFVAALLDAWSTTHDIAVSIEAGKAAGAEATRWRRPLPDEAYGAAAADALRRADEAAARR
jgi:sugar/nucleoside kinase (ribokinase family)